MNTSQARRQRRLCRRDSGVSASAATVLYASTILPRRRFYTRSDTTQVGVSSPTIDDAFHYISPLFRSRASAADNNGARQDRHILDATADVAAIHRRRARLLSTRQPLPFFSS